MRRIIIVVVLVLSFVFLLATGGAYLATGAARNRVAITQKELGDQFARFASDVLSDEARFQSNDLFASPDGGDAAPVIFAHIRWDDDLQSPPPVPPALIEQLKTFGSEWPNHVDDLDLTGVDVTWLQQLDAFGFWDIEAPSSRIHDTPFGGFNGHSPNFLELQSVAKARLVQGLREGNAVAAAHEVRAFARLCLSSETLLGEMIGVAMLSAERLAYEEAVRRNQNVDGWRPFSSDDTEALKRALWAAVAPFSLVAEPPLSTTKIPVGACAGLSEGAAVALELRPYLEDEMADRYAALGQALESSRCRLRRLRVAWKSPVRVAEMPQKNSAMCMVVSEAIPCGIPSALIHVPFARALVGNSALSVAVPDWFRLYRAPPTK